MTTQHTHAVHWTKMNEDEKSDRQLAIMRDVVNYLNTTRKYPHQIVYGCKAEEWNELVAMLNS